MSNRTKLIIQKAIALSCSDVSDQDMVYFPENINMVPIITEDGVARSSSECFSKDTNNQNFNSSDHELFPLNFKLPEECMFKK